MADIGNEKKNQLKMSRSISALYRSALPKPKKTTTRMQMLELDELGFTGDASCMTVADATVHIWQLREIRGRRMLAKLAKGKARV